MRPQFIKCYIIVITCTRSLQPILVSRFFINLRRSQRWSTTTEIAHESQLVFGFRVPTMRSLVADIGEPLEFGDRDNADETAETTMTMSTSGCEVGELEIREETRDVNV